MTEPATKLTRARGVQSVYPYRVCGYQFKELEAARKFNADLSAIPKSGRYRVMMAHRGVENVTVSDGHEVIVAILLDVTDDAPDVAEAKWATK